MFRELCGDSTLRNVVLVTNMWGEVVPAVGEAREKELSDNFFKPVLDRGAQMDRHHDTVQSAHGVIRKIVGNHPLALRIQKELVDEQKEISDTAAGGAVDQGLKEQIERHRGELKSIKEEMAQALRERDEEARRELEEEKRKAEKRIEKIRKDSEGMAASYAAEKERMEARMKQMQEEMQALRDIVGTSITIPIYKRVSELPAVLLEILLTKRFLGPPMTRLSSAAPILIRLPVGCRA